MEIFRDQFALIWESRTLHIVSPTITYCCSLIAASSLTYFAKKPYRIIASIIISTISCFTILFGLTGFLGVAMASSRERIVDSIITKKNEKVNCILIGNAIDDARITRIEKTRKVPYTPFLLRIWKINMGNENIFYGKKGFRRQKYNGKIRMLFWSQPRSKYNIPDCKSEEYRNKHKNCIEYKMPEYLIPVD